MQTAIVVLHYNNAHMTDSSVKSIRDHTEGYHIIVVDNKSDELYECKGDDVTVIRHEKNHNSVDGMNFGFSYALYGSEFEFEYIVNFDNDIICLDNWLPPLIKSMDSDPRIGIVGGKQWDASKEYYRSVGMDLVGGTLYKNMPNKECDVMWIQGSFVMMRAEMMRMIGLHDTRFHTLCSDSDYCIHAKDRGWRVVFVPDSEVIHIGSASYGKGEPCASWESDNKALLQKWSGIKAMAMLDGFPLDKKTNKYVRAKFEIIEDEPTGNM